VFPLHTQGYQKGKLLLKKTRGDEEEEEECEYDSVAFSSSSTATNTKGKKETVV